MKSGGMNRKSGGLSNQDGRRLCSEDSSMDLRPSLPLLLLRKGWKLLTHPKMTIMDIIKS